MPLRDPHPVKVEAKRRGLTIAEIALRAGYTPRALYNVLSGFDPSSPKMRAAVAKVLDMSVEELFPEQAA
jgi:lambda repressor-like predicted transcriptional regulator